jgi:hypothetical protein
MLNPPPPHQLDTIGGTEPCGDDWIYEWGLSKGDQSPRGTMEGREGQDRVLISHDQSVSRMGMGREGQGTHRSSCHPNIPLVHRCQCRRSSPESVLHDSTGSDRWRGRYEDDKDNCPARRKCLHKIACSSFQGSVLHLTIAIHPSH